MDFIGLKKLADDESENKGDIFNSTHKDAFE